MYTKTIPYKDFRNKPQNATIEFNLTEREVFKILPELQAVFKWQESVQGPLRDLSTEEVRDFYNNFEEIVLTAYGQVSDDGQYMDKTGRYLFETSACFAAYMLMCISDPAETSRMIDGIMPKELADMVKKADENLKAMGEDPNSTDAMKAEIDRLRAQLQTEETQGQAESA